MLTVQLENVAVSHADQVILGNVDLRIARAELVYLIGSTGSGKSTLIACLIDQINNLV